ncbi:NAD(P)/FAD-dependent oxidoreductase [Bradyrhizobium roseum]|uniref:NAD(P)/FAD-dependent oxidoreductase n=1 Tax=Bradyrhizobium roseum TaxID=3056648 RepID=UPI0026112A83|nr:tryptophan 7-halogenase [Bradyrhizobium roseus]WKA31323.1 tryptophan 7-halogenase [Bradyrhizobium roseus]
MAPHDRPSTAGLGTALTADVLIVGAGPAGATAACILAPAHSVVIVERHASRRPQIGESLIGAAAPLLRDLGVAAQFASADHLQSLGQASVWGSYEMVRRDSIVDPRGPGWRIDRLAFEIMLMNAAIARGATILAPARISHLSRNKDSAFAWRVLIYDGSMQRELHAQAIIDATGRSASIARRLDANSIISADRLVCRYTHFQPSSNLKDLDAFSVVEAVEHGWWYTATLPNHARIVAFHTDSDLPAARLSLTTDGFRRLLRQTRWMHCVCGDGGQDSVARVSARSQWLANASGEGWCAIGDSAVAFDPLSSQGLFNALYTGLRGGQAISAQLAGDTNSLANYRSRLVRVREAYRRNIAAVYRMETRFGGSEFWARRQSVTE